jgi:plasmid replication initiation protein
MIEKTALVVKSNRLIEASYRLSLVEQQIILYAIVKARDEQRGLTPADPVTIKAMEFAAQFGTNETMVYGQLKEAMETLFKRYVVIHDIDPDTGEPRVTETRWLSTASYIDKQGMIQIIFAPRVIPFVTRLDKEFTSYRLDKIGKLSSVYAVRMYELLVQFLSLGKREFEIAKLRNTLTLTTEYPAIKDFKKYVLDIAVDQINEFTDITTSYTQRKTGRNVTHLLFTIASKDVTPKKPKSTKPPPPPEATRRPKQTPEEKALGTRKLAEIVDALRHGRPPKID